MLGIFDDFEVILECGGGHAFVDYGGEDAPIRLVVDFAAVTFL